MEVEALGNEAGLRSLVAHANDEEFDFGFFRMGGIVNGFAEILNLLVGKVDFNHCLNQT